MSSQTAPSPHIVVVGSLNMDVTVRVPHLPVPGETVLGDDLVTVPGGKGANQAVAAARLGGRVTLLGAHGADDFGQRLRRCLETEGVATDHLRVEAAAPTGCALISVAPDGENSIVVAPGANRCLTPETIRRIWPQLPPPRVLVLQLEVPLASVRTAADLAHEAGATVLLNPAPACPLPSELLSRVDVLIPNRHEAGQLAGVVVDEPAAARQAVQRLQAMGPRQVVLTLGAEGALIADARGCRPIPAPVVTAVDATAAGDAFVGALAVALAHGRSMDHAATTAVAAGALAVTRRGAQPSLPSRSHVEALLERTSAGSPRGR